MASWRSDFVDRTAKKPSGTWAVTHYKEPKSHYKAFEAAERLLKPSSKDKYLEIGCGGGVFLKRISQKAGYVAGIDHSPDMVRLANENNKAAIEKGRAEVRQGDAEALPWEENTFTLTANTSMWFFLKNPQKVLLELNRVLAPNGRLVIATIKRSLLMRLVWGIYGLRLYSDKDMENMLKSAGFCKIKVQSQGFMGQLAYAEKPETA